MPNPKLNHAAVIAETVGLITVPGCRKRLMEEPLMPGATAPLSLFHPSG